MGECRFPARRRAGGRAGFLREGEGGPAPPLWEWRRRGSRLPAVDELLIERVKTREGYHLFCYPFEGRLVHEGLAALIAYRLSRLRPLSFTLAMNDYGFELLAPEPAPLDEALGLAGTQGPERWRWIDGAQAPLFGRASLAEDIAASVNAAELARRQFREIARIAPPQRDP